MNKDIIGNIPMVKKGQDLYQIVVTQNFMLLVPLGKATIFQGIVIGLAAISGITVGRLGSHFGGVFGAMICGGIAGAIIGAIAFLFYDRVILEPKRLKPEELNLDEIREPIEKIPLESISDPILERKDFTFLKNNERLAFAIEEKKYQEICRQIIEQLK